MHQIPQSWFGSIDEISAATDQFLLIKPDDAERASQGTPTDSTPSAGTTVAPMKTHFVDIDGPVHYADFGGDGVPIVMVHGLGGTHLNWLSIGHRFAAEGYRTLAIDLAGFGLTPLAGRSADIEANQALLHRFVEAVVGGPTLIMGNSMGALVGLLEADANPRDVTGLVLLGPALPIVSPDGIKLHSFKRIVLPAVPGIGEQYMRRYYESLTPEEQLDETWQMVFARPDRVPQANRDMALEMAKMRREMDWAIPAFSEASRSIGRLISRRGAFSKLLHRIVPPTILIHGAKDAIVDPEAARWMARQRPDWRFHMLNDVGHVPQAEMPDLVFHLIDDWRRQAVSV